MKPEAKGHFVISTAVFRFNLVFVTTRWSQKVYGLEGERPREPPSALCAEGKRCRGPRTALLLSPHSRSYSPITSYLLPITYYFLPITSYLLPITYYLLLFLSASRRRASSRGFSVRCHSACNNAVNRSMAGYGGTSGSSRWILPTAFSCSHRMSM